MMESYLVTYLLPPFSFTERVANGQGEKRTWKIYTWQMGRMFLASPTRRRVRGDGGLALLKRGEEHEEKNRQTRLA